MNFLRETPKPFSGDTIKIIQGYKCNQEGKLILSLGFFFKYRIYKFYFKYDQLVGMHIF